MTSKIRIATGETWEYNYNHENRLVGVTKRDTSSGPAVLKVWFKYDVLGNRIEKTVDPDGDGPQPAATEKFTYTEDGNAWADLDASSNITTRRMYLDAVDALFARIGSGDPEWYLTDHLGSVRQIADSSGTILDEITYDGFGAILSESSPTTGDRYKYTAREWDTETQLQYNRARYYDPITRRWISQDPLGFDAGDGNLYRYVNNRPVDYIDPAGSVWVATGRTVLPRWRLIERLSFRRDIRRWGRHPYGSDGVWEGYCPPYDCWISREVRWARRLFHGAASIQ